ncbi:MAG: hypothetical protein ABL921_13170, partial [Pirellula sp.]
LKGAIEKIRRELLRMETERKDLSSRPTIGTMSGFRYAIQSDHAKRMQRKNAEIQEQQDELAKAEYLLSCLLNSDAPKVSLP